MERQTGFWYCFQQTDFNTGVNRVYGYHSEHCKAVAVLTDLSWLPAPQVA